MFNKSIGAARYALIIIIFIWPWALWVYGVPFVSTRPPVQSFMPSEDIHANHRRNWYFSCVTAAEAKPDILFIGDSQTSHSIDFTVLAKALPMMRIAACNMLPFSFESTLRILDYMDQGGARPKTIIISGSYGLFFDNPNSTLDQSALLSDTAYLNSMKWKWQRDLYRKEPKLLGKSASSAREFAANQVLQLEQIDLNQLRSTLAGVDLSTVLFNRKDDEVLDNSVTSEDIQEFCITLKNRIKTLIYLEQPVLPALSQNLAPDIALLYRSLRDQFTACVDAAFTNSDSNWNLDERHFLNPKDKADFDYARINDPSYKISIGKFKDVDPMHMNVTGARSFTLNLVSEFGENLEAAHFSNIDASAAPDDAAKPSYLFAAQEERTGVSLALPKETSLSAKGR